MLAHQLGVSRATVARLESGRAVPTVELLSDLAYLWDVNMLYLMGDIDTRERYAFISEDIRLLLKLYRAIPEKSRPLLLDMARDLAQAFKAASKNGTTP